MNICTPSFLQLMSTCFGYEVITFFLAGMLFLNVVSGGTFLSLDLFISPLWLSKGKMVLKR